MNKKISQSKIIDEFLRACAEADDLTDKKEIAKYVKERKQRTEDCMARKDAE